MFSDSPPRCPHYSKPGWPPAQPLPAPSYACMVSPRPQLGHIHRHRRTVRSCPPVGGPHADPGILVPLRPAIVLPVALPAHTVPSTSALGRMCGTSLSVRVGGHGAAPLVSWQTAVGRNLWPEGIFGRRLVLARVFFGDKAPSANSVASNNRNIFSHSLGDQKSKLTMLAGWVPSWGPRERIHFSLPSFWWGHGFKASLT